MLVQSQESDFRLFIDSLENEIVSQIFVAVVNIWSGQTNEHQVDDLLRGIAMLIYQGAAGQVHVASDVLNASREDDTVDEQNDALRLRVLETTGVLFEQIVSQHEDVLLIRSRDLYLLTLVSE